MNSVMDHNEGCEVIHYERDADNTSCKLAVKPKGRVIRGRGTHIKEVSLPTEEKKFCPLCKKNGEMASTYMAHNLKDAEGRVVCPILYKYRCPICKVTGDNAHTESYCPARAIGPSTTGALKHTRRNATGLRSQTHNKQN